MLTTRVWHDRDNTLCCAGLQTECSRGLMKHPGNDPFISNIAYLDTFYGFGRFTFELVAGFDCPQYATFLNSSFYANEVTHTHPNSICLFEFDEKAPLQRHTSGRFVSVTKNTQLVVRAVATVGNYDYTFSYTFGLDGSIGVDVHASGYIQSAFAANNEQYGFKIHDALSGAMHDHVLNFKVDLDVLGTANSVQTVSNVPVSKAYPWSGGKVRNTMALERKFISNEDNGKINVRARAPMMIPSSDGAGTLEAAEGAAVPASDKKALPLEPPGRRRADRGEINDR